MVLNPYSIFPSDLDPASDVNLIEDPLSVDLSNLFDGCYDLLMQMLGRVHLCGEESQNQLTLLADVAVDMMNGGLVLWGEP